MAMFKRLVHIISKSCLLILECWHNSEYLVKQNIIKVRFCGFVDLLFCMGRYGADFSNYLCFHFYQLGPKERNRFITFWRNERLWRWFCGSTQKLFLNKVEFNMVFNNYIIRDWIDTKDKCEDEIKGFIKTNHSVIVKPIESAMGNGIYKIEDNEDALITELMAKIKQGERYIIEETLENVPQIKSLNPPSLNTVRMVTVIDKDGNYHLVGARMRMGATNACTDNVCSGGIVCAIDEKTGVICTSAKNHMGKEFFIHPNSGMNLVGYRIPKWEECVELTKKLAYVVPTARYVGWDLAITTKGIDVLEGNIPPDEGVTQMNHGVGLWHQFLSWR